MPTLAGSVSLTFPISFCWHLIVTATLFSSRKPLWDIFCRSNWLGKITQPSKMNDLGENCYNRVSQKHGFQNKQTKPKKAKKYFRDFYKGGNWNLARGGGFLDQESGSGPRSLNPKPVSFPQTSHRSLHSSSAFYLLDIFSKHFVCIISFNPQHRLR